MNMKKNVLIGVGIVVVVGILLVFGTDLFRGKRATITAPQQGEVVIRSEVYPSGNPVFVEGTTVPGNSVYIVDGEQECVNIATPTLGGGTADADGKFSLALQRVYAAANIIQVVSVTEAEELAYKTSCYPDHFLSEPVTFIYQGDVFIP